MTVKSFGIILIVAGIFISFTFFVFSHWRIDLDFIGNIRYAVLLEFGDPPISIYNKNDNFIITLGQGLLLPLSIIGIGFIVKLEVISSKKLIELLPFLTSNSDN